MAEIAITINVRPTPKPSIRVNRKGGRAFSERYRRYSAIVRKAARTACKDAGWRPAERAVMQVDFVFGTHDSERFGETRFDGPDIDNLEKGLYDPLKKSGLLKDDCRIGSHNNRKSWGPRDQILIYVLEIRSVRL